MQLPLFRRRQPYRPELEGHVVDRTVECEGHLVVLVVHRRAGVDPDVEGLITRDQERDGFWDLLRGDLLAVHLQHAATALCDAGAVAREIELDRVLARREWLLALPAELREHEAVVVEHRLALEQIQPESAP